MIYTEKEFLKLFNFNKTISFEDFSQQLSVLNGSDTSGNFVVRSDLDNRKSRLDLYKRKLYKMLVTEPEVALAEWFNRTAAITENLDYYFQIPNAKILEGNTFAGRTNSKYGRICKNINFEKFFNTKKLYSNDFEYTFGLMKAMFEDFKLRNSLVGPAFFDHICKIDGDYRQFWTDFMMGCNRASIFNPATYKGILEELLPGETLFAPVMGWNAYQLAFYSSKYKHFVATDVIPEVVLFSPPYYDLEIYDSEDQSFTNYPDYQDWLLNYWEATVIIAKQVLKPGGRFAFVISNYRNKAKEEVTISQDMRDVVETYFGIPTHYKVQWSAIAAGRQAKKTRGGNFEDLWLFEK